MEMFIKTFGKDRIKVLLADREFIGKDWIGYLQKQQIPFCIRIKEAGQYIRKAQETPVLAKALFSSLKTGSWTSLGPRFVGKQDEVCVDISAARNHQGELLVVMHSDDVVTPTQTYSLRWQIECLFKALKSGGFNLEDTHLTNPDRIETLLHVLCIAFCHAYDWGNQAQPQKSKRHGYTQNSVFRLGLDLLARALLNPFLFMDLLLEYFTNLLHRFQAQTFFVR